MEITTKVTRKELQIFIPIELIRHLAETGESKLIVDDGVKLATFIGEQIVASDPESGLKVQIDELILQAYEDGHEYMRSQNED